MENLNAEQVKKALECWLEQYKSRCFREHADDALALIESQEQRIKELTEEAEGLKQCMEHEHASFMETFGELDDECKRLTEENDKLHASCTELARVQKENERLIEAGFSTVDYAIDKIRGVRIETVRKMQSEIKERCIKGGIYPAFVASTIDQIAKELEGET